MPSDPWWVRRPPPPPIQPMEQPKHPLTTAQKATGLAAIIGTVAAGVLYVTIPDDEGTRLKAYRDIVGVWTICTGDTKNVSPGQVATKAECEARLERQLIAHAEPVMSCIPTLREEGRDYQRAAVVSLAYNVGVRAVCRSTVARRMNARDFRGGCDAILMWDRAGGRQVRGLTLRRQRERAICLRNL